MKLQSAYRKELTRIALGTLVCDGIMIAGLFLMSQFDMGKFELSRILLGVFCGSIIAILNFAILCITVQSAVGMENKRKMKAKFQLSYNIRLGLQAAWIVACFLIKPIHFIAGAAPILFPNVVIYYLQFTGKLLPKEEAKDKESAVSSEETPSESEA